MRRNFQRESDTKVRSQQAPVAVGGAINPSPLPLFSVEIEERIFKKLNALAIKEKLNINELASELLRCTLFLHRSEVQRVVDEIRRRNHHCHGR